MNSTESRRCQMGDYCSVDFEQGLTSRRKEVIFKFNGVSEYQYYHVRIVENISIMSFASI